MLSALYAVVTVLAWGTWLAPSQKVQFKNQQIKTFYVALANLALAALVFMVQGFSGLTWGGFWLPFTGGLVWAVSGLLAFIATDRLGMARAYGLWAPINVCVSIAWGAVLFNEFFAARAITLVWLAVSLTLILAGVLLIIFAKGTGRQSQAPAAMLGGLASAVGAGVLWGSYYIPIKLSVAPLWAAAFPLSVGIFTGSLVLVALKRQPLNLPHPSDTWRALSTGLLWGIGNYGMLLLVEQIGAGRGFTISQLGIVVNGLVGVYAFKDPAPKSRSAALTLTGCTLATLGGILLGTLE